MSLVLARHGFAVGNVILSYPILSYPILSYPILSYPILSYPILSYPILSYPILIYLEACLPPGGPAPHHGLHMPPKPAPVVNGKTRVPNEPPQPLLTATGHASGRLAANVSPRLGTHRVYSRPAWLRPGQGRYALIGHQPNPGTAPRPPRMRPSPSQLR
jgi:hypothetical protein